MLPARAELAPLLFRWLVVAAQGATLWLTWPVWRHRALPPMMPALDLSTSLDMGWPLIGSLLLVLIAPRWGVAMHLVLLVAAIVMDQMRLQPEFLSLALLMLATLPARGAKLVGRTHLICLWFFSGFHKLVSTGYYEMMHERMWTRVAPELDSRLTFALSAVFALLEISLAVLAWLPRTRRAAAVIAIPFHFAILGVLWDFDWNLAVWPWNAALSLAGFGLLWTWRETVTAELATVRWPAKLAACVLLVSPWGYYLGIIDAYLANCFYAGNIPQAQWNDVPLTGSTMYRGPKENPNQLYVGVPIPPTHRAFEAFFHALAKPGDKLRIEDPRWCARQFGYAERVIVQPAGRE
jgi:hypothetical protein